MDFVTLKNTIIRKTDIISITIEKDVERTCDYDYPDGLRPTNIYVDIDLTDNRHLLHKIDDDDYNTFLTFVKEFYDIENRDDYVSKAADLVYHATIREIADSPNDDAW